MGSLDEASVGVHAVEWHRHADAVPRSSISGTRGVLLTTRHISVSRDPVRGHSNSPACLRLREQHEQGPAKSQAPLVCLQVASQSGRTYPLHNTILSHFQCATDGFWLFVPISSMYRSLCTCIFRGWVITHWQARVASQALVSATRSV